MTDTEKLRRLSEWFGATDAEYRTLNLEEIGAKSMEDVSADLNRIAEDYEKLSKRQAQQITNDLEDMALRTF